MRSVVCRSCAFVFAITEPPVSSPYSLALVHDSDVRPVPEPDPLFVRADRSIAASRERRDELQERLRRARQLLAAALDKRG